MTITPRIPIPIPRYDSPAQSLCSGDDPPTLRIPIPYPPLPPCAPMDTPAPAGRLSGSSISSVGSDGEPVALPRVGDALPGFALVEELGRGAFARVFLAKQDSLANRLVALKVTRRQTHEADKLARLQHANIVPIHSVHASNGLHLICMPYLGRRTIADALRAFHRDHPSKAHSGRKTWGTRRQGTTALGSSGSGSSAGGRASSSVLPVPRAIPDAPAAPLIGDATAVLRTLSALAAGLMHAHARNILHLDIKPANVLLSDSGEPMLLDFNLSLDTGATERGMVGGTVQYMAPEQLLDVRTRGRGRLDARSDLYSLGVLAYEMLAAAVPFPAPSQRMSDFAAVMSARLKPLPSVRERNPDVTPAVDAILRKLLAPNPDHRYQSAADLRADLERQLANQPLLHASDRSVRERLQKWRRRNPWLPARFAAAALIGLVLGTAVAADRQAAARAEAQAATRVQATRVALHALRLDLLLPDDEKARARGKQTAVELLAGFNLPDDADWRKCEAFARLPAAERDAVAADLGEVLLLLAKARWQEGKARPDAERKPVAADALRLTRLARSCFAANSVPPALVRQEREVASAAGEDPTAFGAGESKTPRDHFLDGVDLAAAGRYGAAVVPLEKVVGAQPDHAAAHFYLALCRQHHGQHARAIERYEVARVLLPTDPRPCYQRGLIHGLDRRHSLAEADFSRAIELDPTFADAYRERATARLSQNKPREAELDLTAALDRGAAPFRVRLLRAHVRTSLQDAVGAEADRKAVRETPPECTADYVVRGWTRLESDPKAALADFQAAAKLNPRSIDALERQGYVLAERLNDPIAALSAYTRLVELYPEYARAHAGRAVILARLGQRTEAHRAADRTQLLSDDPAISYRLACVYSRTSVGVPDAAARADQNRGMALLRKAFRDGFRDIRKYESDPDLEPLRQLPEFAEFLRAAKELAR